MGRGVTSAQSLCGSGEVPDSWRSRAHRGHPSFSQASLGDGTGAESRCSERGRRAGWQGGARGGPGDQRGWSLFLNKREFLFLALVCSRSRVLPWIHSRRPREPQSLGVPASPGSSPESVPHPHLSSRPTGLGAVLFLEHCELVTGRAHHVGFCWRQGQRARSTG